MRIPPGFNTVTPYFFVDGAARLLDFLVQGLGGTEIGRHMDGDRIANAQVQHLTAPEPSRINKHKHRAVL